MSERIETQADLEELLSDKDKKKDYMDAVVRESVQDEIKRSVTESLKDYEVKRLPIHEEATNPSQGAVRSGWNGPDVDKSGRIQSATNLMTEARSLNGQFDGFKDFLASIHPSVQMRAGINPRLKVLGEGQGDQGGFLVPDEFVNTILGNSLERAVVRPRAFVMPMAGLTQRHPSIRDASHASTVYGGVQGYWTPESGALTASEPTFSSFVLTAKKLTLYTTASNELLADSAIPLEALLTRLFSEAYAFFEDDAFINGSGAGDPLGIINADALVTVAKETGQAATTIVAENLDKMYSRMLPSSFMNSVWIAHPDTFPQLAGLSRSVGTGGSSVWMTNMVGGAPSSIYGRPLIFSEKCQTLGTAGDIYLVDLSYYVIGDRQTVAMSASPHVRFTNDETVYRFTGRLDGRPWLETALTPRNGSNTLSPFVNLATRS